MDAENNYLEDKQHIRWLKWATVAAVVATLGDFVLMMMAIKKLPSSQFPT